MNSNRLKKVLESMEKRHLQQAVFCDPASIFYLTGRWIEPEERLYALYLDQKGNHKILINQLFTVPEDLGVEKVRFFDTDDSIALLSKCIQSGIPLGVDKNMPARFLLPLMSMCGASAFENVSSCMDEARACKDEQEIEWMRKVSSINDQAMAEFKTLLKEGITEKQVAGQLLEIYRSFGADDFSFHPLVGFGANAAIGHHEPDNTPLRTGDCVLFDVGCKKDYYCADMTRTFFFQEIRKEEYRKVYETVRAANEAAEAAIRPGVPLKNVDQTARDLITEAGYGPNFTHRLGHFIGLEVHEPGDVSMQSDRIATPGNTFSIEPGIYIEGEVGIRIEDLVLVTENGCEILNTFSKELEIIE